MEKAQQSITRTILLVVGIAVAILLCATHGMAQSAAGFMYGKVYTASATYEGQIRWGTEEAFWTDFFNASKKSTSNYKKQVTQDRKEESSWMDFDWDILSIWENKTTIHQFSCQFGDIKELEVLNRSNARLRFKNGLQMEVNGDGYNDIGTKIQVLDKELGWTSLHWDKVQKVEFASIPAGTPVLATAPLYGTVETSRKEKFTGYIQWDHDERVSTDKLDGESRDGKISAAFAEIVSIEKNDGGSDVAFKSGRQLHLTGTNDVNSDNKGIIVIQPGKGMVDIPWNSFKKVTFTAAANSGPSFESFADPKKLSGTVFLYDAKEIAGNLIYDLDESLDVETLEGKDNNIQYTIPFRNIKSIKPKNLDYATIELKNGETLLLGDGRDVSGSNDGILVIVKGKKEPVHVRWKNIDQIIFD
ncbi:MAG: hypothetical protein C0523_01995 [Cytophaga sp.]|nr:hypothetical protein [Cytophaga sp.]